MCVVFDIFSKTKKFQNFKKKTETQKPHVLVERSPPRRGEGGNEKKGKTDKTEKSKKNIFLKRKNEANEKRKKMEKLKNT